MRIWQRFSKFTKPLEVSSIIFRDDLISRISEQRGAWQAEWQLAKYLHCQARVKTEIESERKTGNMRHLRQSVSTLRRLNLCGLGQKQTNDILDQLWERFDTLNIFISSLLIGWGKCLKPSHRMRSANSTCWGLNWKFNFLPMFLWPGCCHKCVHNCHLSWTHSKFTQNDKTQSRSSSLRGAGRSFCFLSHLSENSYATLKKFTHLPRSCATPSYLMSQWKIIKAVNHCFGWNIIVNLTL